MLKGAKVHNIYFLCVQVSIPEADRQDTSAMYKKQTLKGIETEITDFRWREYFQSFLKTEISPEEEIVTYAYDYFKEMATIVKNEEKRWKDSACSHCQLSLSSNLTEPQRVWLEWNKYAD